MYKRRMLLWDNQGKLINRLRNFQKTFNLGDYFIHYALVYSKKNQLWLEGKTSNLLYTYSNLAEH